MFSFLAVVYRRLLDVLVALVLCCSVVVSEWMFELASQLSAVKRGRPIVKLCFIDMLY